MGLQVVDGSWSDKISVMVSRDEMMAKVRDLGEAVGPLVEHAVFRLAATETCKTFQVTARLHQHVQLRVNYVLTPPAGFVDMGDLHLAVGYIPQDSLVTVYSVVGGEVVNMPGTTKDLGLPLTGLVTIQVSGPKVTYTTHGVG